MTERESLTRRALRLCKRGLETTVPLSAWQRLFPKDVVSVFYHMVSDDHLPHLKLYGYQTKSHFDSDMLFVKNTQRLIRYDDLAERRRRGDTRKDNPLLVTFDDGFAECFTAARPVLLRYGIPGAFFVPTDFIDNERLFTESKISLCIEAIERLADGEVAALAVTLEEIKAAVRGQRRSEPASDAALHVARLGPGLSPGGVELVRWLIALEATAEPLMDRLCDQLGVGAGAYLKERQPFLTADQLRCLASDGFTIGAHGRSHIRLSLLDRTALEREIVEACDKVRTITGQKSVPFAFPYSGEGLDVDTLHEIVRKHDFIGLLFDTGGLRQKADFVVNRLYAGSLPSDRRATGATLPDILCSAWSHPQSWPA
jgi:peptidoglycan/xylan/chitin deacetylase (PgdA/CDA1 family)